MVPSVKFWWEVEGFCMQVTDGGGQVSVLIQENFGYSKLKLLVRMNLVLMHLLRKGFLFPRKNFGSEVEQIASLFKELCRVLRE